MRTVILPGFSIKNKAWAEEVREHLPNRDEGEVYYWKHWETGQTEEHWIRQESQRITDRCDGENMNLIAKSIGTAVAMQIYKSNSDCIGKIILCGIPTNDLLPGDEKYYQPLEKINPVKVMIIQNENDNHGNLEQVKEFLNKVNPKLKIVSKPRADHEYPYWYEFNEFLWH